jgi:TRAP-type C4-dicarboxylate transport system, small permease component
LNSVLKSISYWMHKVLLIIAEVALIAMLVMVCANVFIRYVMGTGGIKWIEEVPSLLVAIFAYIAMAMGVRDRLHINVSIIYNLFPKNSGWRKAMDILSDLVMLLCGLFMLYYGFQRLFMQMRFPGTLPMTHWPVWITYIPIPLAGIPITFDSILYLFGVLKPTDLIYGEEEVDYAEILKKQKLEREQEAAH